MDNRMSVDIAGRLRALERTERTRSTYTENLERRLRKLHVSGGTTATQAVLLGLMQGQAYQVAVRAFSLLGSSGWSVATSGGGSAPRSAPRSSAATAAATGKTTPVVITSSGKFTGAFTGETLGDRGGWTYDAAGSTTSASTGPGTNNTLSYMHTETSNTGGILATDTDIENRGIAIFATVPNQVRRQLKLRLCIQGEFGDGTEGVQIEHRASNSDAWSQAGFIHGWAYANNYVVGSSITDENSNTLTCVAKGGWVDFTVNIPDSANQVRLHPRYIQATGNQYTHDIALRQFVWEWTLDTPAAPTLTGGDTQLDVSWTAINIPVTGYNLRYREGTSGDWTDWPHTGTDTMTTITGLTNGQVYQVQVQTVSAGGISNWSVEASGTPVQPAGPPAAPAAPILTGSNTRLGVSWTAPSDGRSAITGYDIQYREGSMGGWTDWPHTGTDTITTITGLTDGQVYQVQVRAVNALGSSDWSVAGTGAAGVLPIGPPATPAAPALIAGPGQLGVTWTAPYNGGSSIVGYGVRYRPGVSGSWQTLYTGNVLLT